MGCMLCMGVLVQFVQSGYQDALVSSLQFPHFAGSPGTEPGTGNRTVLEPEPVEPALKTEPGEPDPIFGSEGMNRNRPK